MSITEEISKYITLAFYAYQQYPQWKAYLRQNGPDINGRIKKITDPYKEAYDNFIRLQLPEKLYWERIQRVYEDKRFELLEEINNIVHGEEIPFKKKSVAKFLENNPKVIELIGELMLNEAMYMGRDSYTEVKYSRDPNNPGKEIKTKIDVKPIALQLPTDPNSYAYVLLSIIGDPTKGGVDLTPALSNVTDDELNDYIEVLNYKYNKEHPGSSYNRKTEREKMEEMEERNKYLESIHSQDSVGDYFIDLPSDRDSDPDDENRGKAFLAQKKGDYTPEDIERKNELSAKLAQQNTQAIYNTDLLARDYGRFPIGSENPPEENKKRKPENESDNGRKSRKTTEGGRRTRRTRKGRKGRKGKARKTKRGRKQRRTKRR